jgi:hypothetical protein
VIEKKIKNDRSLLESIKKISRIVGILMALPFFIWLPLGLLTSVPSMIDVFGMQGLRIPTGIVIGGLVLAAFGFEDF